MKLLSLEPESSASANSAIPAYNLARSRVTLAVPEIFTAVHLKISTAAPFLPSLLRPPDAVKLKAANSATSAYSYILYAQNTVVSRKKYINFITFILLDISSSNFIMLFKTPTFKLKVGVICYFLWWGLRPTPHKLL